MNKQGHVETFFLFVVLATIALLLNIILTALGYTKAATIALYVVMSPIWILCILSILVLIISLVLRFIIIVGKKAGWKWILSLEE